MEIGKAHVCVMKRNKNQPKQKRTDKEKVKNANETRIL